MLVVPGDGLIMSVGMCIIWTYDAVHSSISLAAVPALMGVEPHKVMMHVAQSVRSIRFLSLTIMDGQAGHKAAEP